MTDNNYECLFEVSKIENCNRKSTASKKQSKEQEDKDGVSKVKPSEVLFSNINNTGYFTQPKHSFKSNVTASVSTTQHTQTNPIISHRLPSNSLNSKLSNENVLSQEQIDQIEKILPNGQRTKLYMYYYNYYVQARPGRTKEYYDNLIQQYINICKERLSRINEIQNIERSKQQLSQSTEICIGPKFTHKDDIIGNLYYWFGINKLNNVIKWYDTTLDKDQNYLDKDDVIYYRRNVFLRKNWYYMPNGNFKYITTSFEPHSIVMASINENSFASFAYTSGYKSGQKKVFLEYTASYQQ